MHELVMRLPEALVEPVSEALVDELGALSVSVEDADAGTAAEHALFGEPGMPPPAQSWARSRVVALFPIQPAAEEAARAQSIVDAFAANPGVGVLQVDGKMVDAPHLKQAKHILSLAD